MKERKVSRAVIRRLPRYLRVLTDMEAEGLERISSGELSERIGYTASQIRQDLNHFGGFGQQGYGYNVPALRTQIAAICEASTPERAMTSAITPYCAANSSSASVST